jgi:hypothetical protein
VCTICNLRIEFQIEHPLTLSVAVATRQAIVAGILPTQPSVPDPLSMRLRLEAIAALRAVQGRFEQSLTRDALMALLSCCLMGLPASRFPTSVA